MFAHLLWFSTILLGIDAGWQPLPDGGVEYIVQLDSQTLEALKAGQPIQSDIPPDAGDVRSFKFVVGSQALPRKNPLPAATQTTSKKNSDGISIPPSNPLNKTTPEQSTAFPKKLNPDPTGKPLTAQSAAFVEQTEKKSEANKDEPTKPWLPLILVSLCLFASLGGNVFLAWIFADLRRRFKATFNK